MQLNSMKKKLSNIRNSLGAKQTIAEVELERNFAN